MFQSGQHKESKESQLRETVQCPLEFSELCALPAPNPSSQDQDTLAPFFGCLAIFSPVGTEPLSVRLPRCPLPNAHCCLRSTSSSTSPSSSPSETQRRCFVPFVPQGLPSRVAQAQRSSLSIREGRERMLTECGLKSACVRSDGKKHETEQ